MKKKTFSEELAEQFRATGFEATDDTFSDRSARWVEVKKDGYVIEIDFDLKGQKIIGMSLHKDIVQVVYSKRLF